MSVAGSAWMGRNLQSKNIEFILISIIQVNYENFFY